MAASSSSFEANPMDFDSNPQNSSEQLDKVCIIGSGNWGSAIATKIGRNCARLPFFEERVNMWVYEEMVEVEGCSEKQKLTEVINTRHENVKYLPGIPLPENVVAVADLEEACKDATLLIFVLPHQFLPRLLPTIRASAHPSCRGVSLIKGIGKCSINPTCDPCAKMRASPCSDNSPSHRHFYFTFLWSQSNFNLQTFARRKERPCSSLKALLKQWAMGLNAAF
jgi:hypothetical protein